MSEGKKWEFSYRHILKKKKKKQQKTTRKLHVFVISGFQYYLERNKKPFEFQGSTVHSHFSTHVSLTQFSFKKLVKSITFSALG